MSMMMPVGMLEGLGRIENALAGYHLTPEDLKMVQEEYKRICYEWAQTDAVACVFEDNLMRTNPALFEQCMNATANAERIMSQLLSSYPEEWLDPEERSETHVYQ